jgi:hypothetical protein
LHPEPRFNLSFAFQKRIKAFYSTKKNAPFAMNRKERAFSGKMCRNDGIFASNSE